jgi:hypothetical protein
MDPLILDNVIKLKADGYKSIYYVKTKGLELIFRPLTFDEYETLMGLESYIDEAAINDCILDIAVLFCTKEVTGLSRIVEHLKLITLLKRYLTYLALGTSRLSIVY